MNFLAHLFLSSESVESRIGSLLGDFTRIGNSNLYNYYPPGIADAVVMHRKIDSFTDAHEDVSEGVRILFETYRHYSRIVIDIYFDHFLTKNWHLFTDISFDGFIDSVHASLADLPNGLPESFYLFAKRLKMYEILKAYASIEDLSGVFKRTEERMKYKSGIDSACEALICHYDLFNTIFLSFFPKVINYVKDETYSKKAPTS